jgi:HNH endonuclease
MTQRYKHRKVKGVTHQEHRLVYEEHHGPIPPGWHVHHKDGDGLNNAPDNLVALPPHEHARIHNQKHPVTKECVVCGVTFTPHPTKRERAKTCSRSCFSELARRNAHRRNAANVSRDREIREAWEGGVKGQDLAERFGLSPASISRIVNS